MLNEKQIQQIKQYLLMQYPGYQIVYINSPSDIGVQLYRQPIFEGKNPSGGGFMIPAKSAWIRFQKHKYDSQDVYDEV